MTELTKEDWLFCRPCIYRSSKTGACDNLCDFILLTGKPRGCPPGARCGKRVLKKRKRIATTAKRPRNDRKKKSPETVQASQGAEIN